MVSVHANEFYVDPPTRLSPATNLVGYYAAGPPLATSDVALAGPPSPEAKKATSVERLTEVKEMLDMDLISKLEYDEKKKEIMAGV